MRGQSSRRRPLQALPPTETLDLGVAGLSLSPRLKLLLTFFRSDPSVRPIDEWQLRRALLGFLREPLSLPVPEEDLLVHRRPDLQKRRREDPVASGVLFVRDLGFLKKKADDRYKGGGGGGGGGRGGTGEEEEDDEEGLRKGFLEWRDSVVGRMDGIELNLEGVKFRLAVEIPPSEDFDQLKKSWEDFYANQSSGDRYSSRGIVRRPDTLLVTGVPSRWFAEPRVSSKPSMLVTHTIFSVLGKIRNLNVACDDDPSKKADAKGDVISGLHCKAWVQFENYDDFCNATRVLCGRSMLKAATISELPCLLPGAQEGTRLKADYEVSWDRDGFFRSMQQKTSRSNVEESSQTRTHPSAGHLRREYPRLQSEVTRVVSDAPHRKRFRE